MVLVIKHVISEGPGLIGDFLKSKGYNLKVVELEKGNSLPESFLNIKAVISMGGPMGVYEDRKYSFLKEEDILIKQVIKKHLPFLGVCLGAQLLAKAAGAEVRKADCNEIGFVSIEFTEEGRNDPLFRGLSKSMGVFQWHKDSFSIPDKGVLLAKGDKCRNQAFKIGECAYGLQFHIESTPVMIKKWLYGESGSNNFNNKEAERIINESGDMRIKMFPECLKVFTNFCNILDHF